jgi:IclR family acetate operon transcriptional repressor
MPGATGLSGPGFAPTKVATRRVPPRIKVRHVKSSVRALEILEFFEQAGQPCRASDISRALNLPNSSVDRILKSLVDSGHLLMQWPSKLYRPSYRVIRTCNRIEEGFFGGRAARDLVEAARQQTGAAAFLCLQNDCWVECVASLPDARGAANPVDEGTRFSICESAAGLALLSLKTRLEIVEVSRRSDKLSQSASGADYGPVLLQAAQARMQGYCARPDGDGRLLIAAPIRHPRVTEPLCIGIVAPASIEAAAVDELGAALRRIVHTHSAG